MYAYILSGLDEPSISKLHLVHDLGDGTSMSGSLRSGLRY